jgi:hypothetical protein
LFKNLHSGRNRTLRGISERFFGGLVDEKGRLRTGENILTLEQRMHFLDAGLFVSVDPGDVVVIGIVIYKYNVFEKDGTFFISIEIICEHLFRKAEWKHYTHELERRNNASVEFKREQRVLGNLRFKQHVNIHYFSTYII